VFKSRFYTIPTARAKFPALNNLTRHTASNLVSRPTFVNVNLLCVGEGGGKIKIRAISLSAAQMQLKLGPRGSKTWTRSGY
jgi:hypothetical protein